MKNFQRFQMKLFYLRKNIHMYKYTNVHILYTYLSSEYYFSGVNTGKMAAFNGRKHDCTLLTFL